MRWLIGIGACLCLFTGAALLAQSDGLPEGEGKRILLTSCTTCHDLTEVTKLRGYYTRAQWRDLIVTMKEYGATVDDKQIDTLADYLGEAIGKK